MIPRIESTWQRKDWQAELANAISDPQELLQRLGLPMQLLPAAQKAAILFPLKVTESYLARIESGNPNDPLLRQVLPLGAECDAQPGFTSDPVGDQAALVAPGLLHKYAGRVLLMTTQACAIHCRYCFRRHYPYQQQRATENWRHALEYIKQHREIHEVILSGGDPLSLSNHKIAELLAKLDSIEHVLRVRFHTRYPIVLPQRIDTDLMQAMAMFQGKRIMVIHANHPNEINAEVAASLNMLNNHNVTLLNQAVLLNGVNANSETLCALQLTLFDCNVLPYYLHQLDKVQGARHFAVPESTARKIMAELQAKLPGYLLPRFVTEIAGMPSKSLII